MPKLPKLKLTVHAQLRLVERNIDVDLVKQVILEPDSRKSDQYGTIRSSKNFKGKTLVVVYSEAGFKDKKNEYTIITFYYLDK